MRVGVVHYLRPRLVVRRVDARSDQLAADFVRVARPHALLLERLDEPHALPAREIDLVSAESRLRAAERRLRSALDEGLRSLHRVLVIDICLVPLQLRELW